MRSLLSTMSIGYRCWTKTKKNYVCLCLLCDVSVPPKISPFNADQDLHLGERTTLTCAVSRGDLPLTIFWLKDGRTMGPSERVTVTSVDQFTSILMIEALTQDHNGNYSCVARNAAAEISHTQRLVVHGNPRLKASI